jgi:hypothetical protein
MRACLFRLGVDLAEELLSLSLRQGCKSAPAAIVAYSAEILSPVHQPLLLVRLMAIGEEKIDDRTYAGGFGAGRRSSRRKNSVGDLLHEILVVETENL